MANDSQLNQRLSIALREVEQSLKKRTDNFRKFKFVDAVIEARRDGALSSKQADVLEVAWKVRGLFAHDVLAGHDPVEATPTIVREVERIRNRMVGRVPTVQGLLRKVTTADPGTAVSKVARAMTDSDFSCIPIYEGYAYVGAVDADAVLKWITDRLEHDELLEDGTVSDVRAATSDAVIEFHRSDALQRDVLAAFERGLAHGAPLAAVLLTDDGTRSGRLRGILTPWDTPGLHR